MPTTQPFDEPGIPPRGSQGLADVSKMPPGAKAMMGAPAPNPGPQTQAGDQPKRVTSGKGG